MIYSLNWSVAISPAVQISDRGGGGAHFNFQCYDLFTMNFSTSKWNSRNLIISYEHTSNLHDCSIYFKTMVFFMNRDDIWRDFDCDLTLGKELSNLRIILNTKEKQELLLKLFMLLPTFILESIFVWGYFQCIPNSYIYFFFCTKTF